MLKKHIIRLCVNDMNVRNGRLNNKGFTLIEVLAVLAILAIVSVIGVYTVSNIVNDAKSKSYSVTINNIEKYSETYVLENDKNIMWFDFGINSLYQCVSVENMIDMGYFSNDILESKVSDNRKVLRDDFIFIEKDKDTKNIKRYQLLYDNTSLTSYCSDIIDSNGIGYVSFKVVNSKIWTKSKEVLITYILDTTVGNYDNYKYGYEYYGYNDYENISKHDFNYNRFREVTKNVLIKNNGNLYADIVNIEDSNNLVSVGSNSTEVGYIDIARPTVGLGEYTSGVVRGSVIIPIKLTDEQLAVDKYKDGSGINLNSISNSDFKVYIGDNLLTSGVSFDKNNYSLRIENYNYAGKLKIIVLENQILDNVGYGNEKVELNPEIEFTNLYNVSYNACGGTGSMDDIKYAYGMDYELKHNEYIKNGYDFLGWSTIGCSSLKVDYGDKYKFKPFNLKNDIILYAVWKDNTPPSIPTYVANFVDDSGSYNSGTWTNEEVKTTLNTTEFGVGGVYFQYQEIGSSTWTTFNFSHYGGVKQDGNVWNGTEKWTLGDRNQSYYFRACDKENNCSNKSVVFNIKYDITPPSIPTYVANYVDDSGSYNSGIWTNKEIKTTLNTTETGVGGVYLQYQKSGASIWTTFNFSHYGGIKQNGNVWNGTEKWTLGDRNDTYYFRACDDLDNCSNKSTELNIKYDVTPPTCSLRISGDKILFYEKKDNRGVSTGWLSTSSSATSGSENLNLTAGLKYGFVKDYAGNLGTCNLKVNKVTINYNVNGGTLDSQTSSSSGEVYNWTINDAGTINYNHELINGTSLGQYGLSDYNNSNYINITRTGYIGKSGAEWVCLSDNCKGKTYSQNQVYTSDDFCDASNNDCSVLLGVNWIKKTYTISYDACSGTGAPDSQIKTDGEDLTLSSVKPTRPGYYFVGWSDADSCSSATSKKYDPGATYTINATDTLYAVWYKYQASSSSSSSKPSSSSSQCACSGLHPVCLYSGGYRWCCPSGYTKVDTNYCVREAAVGY